MGDNTATSTNNEFLDALVNRGIKFESYRSGFMRALASKKKSTPEFPDSHSYLVDALYKNLESTYGKRIHKDADSANSRKIALTVGLDEEQLTYALLGAERYHVPWNLLEKMHWVDRIGLFEGLARFESEKGDPRYFFVPNAHLKETSLEKILSEIMGKSSINKNIYRTPLEDLDVNCNLSEADIMKFTRHNGCSSDFITYLKQNEKGLPTKEDIRQKYWGNKRKSDEIMLHTSVEARIIARLKAEGYVTFAEVDISSIQKHITRNDVIAVKKSGKNIEVIVYDAKCATGLKNDFVETAEKLKETAEFMFYNFGVMPHLIIEKKFPSMPIPVDQPAVNPDYVGRLRPSW